MAAKNIMSGDGVTKMNNAFRVDPNLLVIVGIDTKHRSVDEHWAFDPRITLPVDENKLANIQAGNVSYIVVDGRQRVRMAREANKRLKKAGEPLLEVPVVVEKDSDEDTLVALNTSLNEVGVQDDLLAKAEKAARLKTRGKSIGQIAEIFGKTPNTIRNYLHIHNLPEDMKVAVKKGKVTVAAAIEMAKKSAEERAKILAGIPETQGSQEEQAEGEGDDGGDVDVENKAAKKHAPRTKMTPKKRTGPSARELKGELTPKKFKEMMTEIINTESFQGKLDPQFKLGVMVALQLKPLAELPKKVRAMFQPILDITNPSAPADAVE
jgi:ParB family chromosome partitioning protein